MGTLPDFLIIGAAKSGTTTLYGLLRSHPHVRAAVRREIHFFDENFEKGVEWYRGHFKAGANRGGRRTITGESSPSYLPDERVPRRVAEILPEVRLIALLRNPVDRAYSHYQQAVKHGRVHLSFEEVIEAEISRSSGSKRYLARGIYVDQLKRWHRCFDRKRLLVLKSEDFFGDAPDALERVLDFLELPEWKPDHLPVKNKGSYTRQMSPETRARLRDFFEPHNQRLYDYLGTDFGWEGSLKPARERAKRPVVYYPAAGGPRVSGPRGAQEPREPSEMQMPEVGGGPLPHDQQTASERPWWHRMFGG